MYKKDYHIHFVGIGGIGMSAIAEVLVHMGYRVSGSDTRLSDITNRLTGLGVAINEHHDAFHVKGADVVVTSSAIHDDNPEVLAAKGAGVAVIPRAAMLAELMGKKYSIAVAGAHGKTSTTGIIADVLKNGGLDPTVMIGGNLKSTGTNAVVGQGEHIVVEADESDGSFLHMSPAIAVVTNIDIEHLDFYRDLNDIQDIFLKFIDRIPFYGVAILCLDSEPLKSIMPKISKRFITYGLNVGADFQARDVVLDGLKSRFAVYHLHQKLGEVALNLPGIHNVSNALAGVVAGIELGMSFPVIRDALNAASGVARRLETKGHIAGIRIIDDYGHHPTEICHTLRTIKGCWPERRIVCAFQPHRYTRTAMLFDDFVKSLSQFDVLVVLPIYAAGELPIKDVSSSNLVKSIIHQGHGNVSYAKDQDRVIDLLKDELKPGDIFLTLGAGDVWQVGEEMLKVLR